ncbi:MAG: hypothetical protein WDM71_10055 [Ferruginibacter sp.]
MKEIRCWCRIRVIQTYRSAVKLAGGVCVDYDLKEENNYEPDFASN